MNSENALLGRARKLLGKAAAEGVTRAGSRPGGATGPHAAH
jgi:hypothetical protein